MSTDLQTAKNQEAGFTVTESGASIMDLLNTKKTQEAFRALAGTVMTPERMLKLCISAIQKTPKLKKCDPLSVLGAMMTAASLGLEPNTVQQQAFLIPYDKRGKVNGQWTVVGTECQFQIGYRGFITLGYRSPEIMRIEASAIHEGDFFEHMQGSDSFLKYAKALKERGDLIGAYCFVELASGGEAAYVMPLEEIHKIRSKSETYNALLKKAEDTKLKGWELEKAKEKLADTPWVMWEDDMAAKSVIKKLAKTLPLSGGNAITAAAELDGDVAGRTIDMTAMSDPERAHAVVRGEEAIPMIEKQEQAEIISDLNDMKTQQAEPETKPAEEKKPAPRGRGRAGQKSMDME